MIYTIFFYILLTYYSTRNNVKSLKWCCVLVALFYGLRYDYMPDYMGYYRGFIRFSDPNYIYDALLEHYEIGWIWLNKLFAPLGFFTFVFVCSCIFAYGVFKMVDCFKLDYKMLPIVLVGYFSQPSTAVLCSAQRQFLVTGIFLLAFSSLVYGKINSIKSLYSLNSLIYYAIIFLCTLFHSSAYVLILVPFVGILPRNNFSVLFIIIFLILFAIYGESYLPFMFNSFLEESGNYTYLSTNEIIKDGSDLTALSIITYLFQIFFLIKTLYNKLITKDEIVIILISLIAIVFSLTAPYLPQIYRLAMYLNLFFFLSIPIVYKYLSIQYKNFFIIGMLLWISWSALKTLSPIVLDSGRDVSYKLIFEVLLKGSM